MSVNNKDIILGYVIVITQDEYDILIITWVWGKVEDEC